jgi:hypothetical protein
MKTTVWAIALAAVLAMAAVPFSSIAAWADDNDSGDRGKKKGKDQGTQDGSNRQTGNKTSGQSHKPLRAAALAVMQYTPGMNYTLNANGTAMMIGNKTLTDDAQISIDLDVKKVKKGLIALEVTNGTITVGNFTGEIDAGRATYTVKSHKMVLTGFLLVPSNNDAGGNSTSTNTNSTTTNTNSTSTNTSGTSTDDRPHEKPIKLWIKVSGPSLPTEESPEPVDIQVLGPRSKLASKWFLNMDGEISLS